MNLGWKVRSDLFSMDRKWYRYPSVRIDNLPPDITEVEVIQLCRSYGTIRQARLTSSPPKGMTPGRSSSCSRFSGRRSPFAVTRSSSGEGGVVRPVCFVDFYSEEDALMCDSCLNGANLRNYRLHVRGLRGIPVSPATEHQELHGASKESVPKKGSTQCPRSSARGQKGYRNSRGYGTICRGTPDHVVQGREGRGRQGLSCVPETVVGGGRGLIPMAPVQGVAISVFSGSPNVHASAKDSGQNLENRMVEELGLSVNNYHGVSGPVGTTGIPCNGTQKEEFLTAEEYGELVSEHERPEEPVPWESLLEGCVSEDHVLRHPVPVQHIPRGNVLKGPIHGILETRKGTPGDLKPAKINFKTPILERPTDVENMHEDLFREPMFLNPVPENPSPEKQRSEEGFAEDIYPVVGANQDQMAQEEQAPQVEVVYHSDEAEVHDSALESGDVRVGPQDQVVQEEQGPQVEEVPDSDEASVLDAAHRSRALVDISCSGVIVHPDVMLTAKDDTCTLTQESTDGYERVSEIMDTVCRTEVALNTFLNAEPVVPLVTKVAMTVDMPAECATAVKTEYRPTFFNRNDTFVDLSKSSGIQEDPVGKYREATGDMDISRESLCHPANVVECRSEDQICESDSNGKHSPPCFNTSSPPPPPVPSSSAVNHLGITYSSNNLQETVPQQTTASSPKMEIKDRANGAKKKHKKASDTKKAAPATSSGGWKCPDPHCSAKNAADLLSCTNCKFPKRMNDSTTTRYASAKGQHQGTGLQRYTAKGWFACAVSPVKFFGWTTMQRLDKANLGRLLRNFMETKRQVPQQVALDEIYGLEVGGAWERVRIIRSLKEEDKEDGKQKNEEEEEEVEEKFLVNLVDNGCSVVTRKGDLALLPRSTKDFTPLLTEFTLKHAKPLHKADPDLLLQGQQWLTERLGGGQELEFQCIQNPDYKDIIVQVTVGGCNINKEVIEKGFALSLGATCNKSEDPVSKVDTMRFEHLPEDQSYVQSCPPSPESLVKDLYSNWIDPSSSGGYPHPSCKGEEDLEGSVGLAESGDLNEDVQQEQHPPPSDRSLSDHNGQITTVDSSTSAGGMDPVVNKEPPTGQKQLYVKCNNTSVPKNEVELNDCLGLREEGMPKSYDMCPSVENAEESTVEAPPQPYTLLPQPCVTAPQPFVIPPEPCMSNYQLYISPDQPCLSPSSPVGSSDQPYLLPSKPVGSPSQPCLSPSLLCVPPSQGYAPTFQTCGSPLPQPYVSPSHPPSSPHQPYVSPCQPCASPSQPCVLPPQPRTSPTRQFVPLSQSYAPPPQSELYLSPSQPCSVLAQLSIHPSQEPVQLSRQPVEPSQQPDHQSQQPVQPSQQPLQPSQQPNHPSQQPVQSSQQPAQTSQQPVQPSQQPVQPSQQPVQPSQQPNHPSQQPVESSQQPVQSSQQPVQPSQQPVQPSQQPVQPSQQPVQPFQQPVQSSQQPVQPSQQPAQPSQQPAQPSQQPNHPSQQPAQSSQHPVQPSQQSVQPSQQPVQPSQQPVQPSQQPNHPSQQLLQPSQEPVQPSQQPVQSSQQPEQPSQQPVQPSQQPVQPSQQPEQPFQPPVQPSQQPVQPSQQPVQPSQQPVQPSQQPAQSSQQPVQPSQEPVQPSQQPVQPFQQPVQLSQQPVQPSQQPVQSSQQPVQPFQQPVQPSQQPVQPSQQPVQPFQQPVQPSQQLVQPSQEPVQPSQEPVQPSQQLVQPSQQPVQLSQQPVQPSQQPAQPSQQPVQPSQQPAQPSQQPAQSSRKSGQPFPGLFQPPARPSQPPILLPPKTHSSQLRPASLCLKSTPKAIKGNMPKAKYGSRGKRGTGRLSFPNQRAQGLFKEPVFSWHRAPAMTKTPIPEADTYEWQSSEAYQAVKEPGLEVSMSQIPSHRELHLYQESLLPQLNALGDRYRRGSLMDTQSQVLHSNPMDDRDVVVQHLLGCIAAHQEEIKLLDVQGASNKMHHVFEGVETVMKGRLRVSEHFEKFEPIQRAVDLCLDKGQQPEVTLPGHKHQHLSSVNRQSYPKPLDLTDCRRLQARASQVLESASFMLQEKEGLAQVCQFLVEVLRYGPEERRLALEGDYTQAKTAVEASLQKLASVFTDFGTAVLGLLEGGEAPTYLTADTQVSCLAQDLDMEKQLAAEQETHLEHVRVAVVQELKEQVEIHRQLEGSCTRLREMCQSHLKEGNICMPDIGLTGHEKSWLLGDDTGRSSCKISLQEEEGGEQSLFEFIQREQEQGLPQTLRSFFIGQIIKDLSQAHKTGTVVGNLHPRHIQIRDGVPWLAADSSGPVDCLKDEQFIAPEFSSEEHRQPGDVYSLGKLIQWLADPESSNSRDEAEVKDEVLLSMLSSDPTMRPTLAEIQGHVWFSTDDQSSNEGFEGPGEIPECMAMSLWNEAQEISKIKQKYIEEAILNELMDSDDNTSPRDDSAEEINVNLTAALRSSKKEEPSKIRSSDEGHGVSTPERPRDEQVEPVHETTGSRVSPKYYRGQEADLDTLKYDSDNTPQAGTSPEAKEMVGDEGIPVPVELQHVAVDHSVDLSQVDGSVQGQYWEEKRHQKDLTTTALEELIIEELEDSEMEPSCDSSTDGTVPSELESLCTRHAPALHVPVGLGIYEGRESYEIKGKDNATRVLAKEHETPGEVHSERLWVDKHKVEAKDITRHMRNLNPAVQNCGKFYCSEHTPGDDTDEQVVSSTESLTEADSHLARAHKLSPLPADNSGLGRGAQVDARREASILAELQDTEEEEEGEEIPWRKEPHVCDTIGNSARLDHHPSGVAPTAEAEVTDKEVNEDEIILIFEDPERSLDL